WLFVVLADHPRARPRWDGLIQRSCPIFSVPLRVLHMGSHSTTSPDQATFIGMPGRAVAAGRPPSGSSVQGWFDGRTEGLRAACRRGGVSPLLAAPLPARPAGRCHPALRPLRPPAAGPGAGPLLAPAGATGRAGRHRPVGVPPLLPPGDPG